MIGKPAWISMGYTATGGEVLNGICELDLLLGQPGIDLSRVGVTGMSGGGSLSFRIAAAVPGARRSDWYGATAPTPAGQGGSRANANVPSIQ